MPTLDIVLSPALWHLQDAKDKNIVVIDIFRATSTIAAALMSGASAVHPVEKADQAKVLGQKGYLTAGERNGLPLEGFDFGNSPVLIQDERIKGKKLALTTTNGTKCFEMAKQAEALQIFSGAFSNIKATAIALINDHQDVVLFCAGWKEQANLEDTLFAGALYTMLKGQFVAGSDAVLMAEDVYLRAEIQGLKFVLSESSHFKRLEKYGAERDMDFSLKLNLLNQCVILHNDELVLSSAVN
ncbi:2-phosphosulfolactate phosphatase [Bacteroidia bacterium]|mgnify:CR=1 FL=1|nr:2-phosphosulfolactate phosphatase [Bacteroidia bacterium]